MDPINPWLDPIEVRRLAERLMRPMRDPAVTVTDAGFDEAFVGYTGARGVAVQPAAPVQIPAAAVVAPAPVQEAVPARIVGPPVEETPPPPPPPVPPGPPVAAKPATPPTEEPVSSGARGPFLDRIQRFRDWMHHHFNASGIFILDREGSVIFDESHHGRLHFLARSLALASRRPGSSSGNVHVKIGAGATLEVIPVETAYGSLVLGAVVPDALPQPAISAIMEALAQVASPPAAT